MGGEWDRKLSGLLLLLSLSSMLLPASCIDLDEAQPFSLAKQMQLCVRERHTQSGVSVSPIFFLGRSKVHSPKGVLRRREGPKARRAVLLSGILRGTRWRVERL